MAVEQVLAKKLKPKQKVPPALNRRQQAGRVDWIFVIILLALMATGLVMVFSAGYFNAYYYENDSFYFIKKQALFAGLGLLVMAGVSRVKYTIYQHFATITYGVSLFLLVVVLFYHTTGTDQKRWIPVPGINSFQPSEVAKFAIILLFASLIAQSGEEMKSFKLGFVRFGAYVAPVIVLLLLEPHLSGVVLVGLIAFVMMAVGGTRGFYLLATLGLMGLGFYLIIKFDLVSYASERITIWRDPFSSPRNTGYQTIQSLFAIASGGLFGQGLADSRQKFLYLPEPQNDFIFAIISEELGFVGATLIMLGFVLLVIRGLYIAIRVRDIFGKMLVVGIISQIGIQAMLNIAVVTNAVPNTGISLPFFSYGGTSLLMILGQVGILLNVSRYQQREPEDEDD